MNFGRVVASEAWRLRAVTLLCWSGLAAIMVAASAGVGPRLVSWAVGGLTVIVAAGIASVLLRGWPRSPAVRIAFAAWAAFAAWSLASVLWADDPASAWEGAWRTVVLGAASVLGACAASVDVRRRSGSTFVVWAVAAGLGSLVVVVMLLASEAPRDSFLGDRLVEPVGYANGQAALLLMSAWVALGVAVSVRQNPRVRALGAATFVLAGGLMLLTLSRGALMTLPAAVVVFLVVAPLRDVWVSLLACVAALMLATPALLEVGPALRVGVGEAPTINRGLWWLLGSAVLAAIVVGFGSRRTTATHGSMSTTTTTRRRHPRRRTLMRLTVLCGCLAAVAAAGLGAAIDRFSSGYTERSAGESRLLDGGSNRGDFFAAAIDIARDAPVLGVGADNFGVAYLPRATVRETPRYPHSWPLAVAAQLGLVGVVLVGAWFVALVSAATSVGRGDRDQAMVGAVLAAAAGFLTHGAIDWLWEFPAAGWAGFFVIGTILGLATATPADRLPAAGTGRTRVDVARAVGALAVTGGAAVALLVPAAGARDTTTAARGWVDDPARAYSLLDRAARRDPLSPRPYLTAGTIAVRRGTLTIADRYFAAALARNRSSTLALIVRAAIASRLGERQAAARFAAEAQRLHPVNPVVMAARVRIQRGETVDPATVLGQIGAMSRAIGSD